MGNKSRSSLLYPSHVTTAFKEESNRRLLRLPSPTRGACQLTQKLYELGARKIVVFDVAAPGCLPAMTNRIAFSSVCEERVNQLVNEYNRLLPQLVEDLKCRLPGTVSILGRVSNSFQNIYQNPSKFGFKYTNIPCCVVDDHGTTPCVPNKTPCQDRNQHIFYDAIHTSEAANAIIANQCFSQSSVCSPINIQQLAAVQGR
ncbi:GDSL esterase/lipase At1g71250-like [Magnolia sinica]|uniref:GDSL esterase/lipase At1g71250-like n=1 Tax=Magnolia sinica TaxID=86752 RepID=UPI002659EC02|nr:GDSL esterase/lipase At1g71250-like [Magnolia sinica]